MRYVDESTGIVCHTKFWLLPKDFLAITLFGHVFYRLTDKEFVAMIPTDSFKRVMNHESIHVLQANSFRTRYFAFYIVYLWYWFIGLFKYGVKNNASYHKIPFEIEAYRNERDMNYPANNPRSRWKEYIP